MALDTNDLADLMNQEAYPVMFEAYGAIEQVRTQVANQVHDVTPDLYHGTKGTVIGGVGRPQKIEHGQEIPVDQIAKAHVWYMKTRKWGSGIDITREEMEATNAAGKVGDLITNFAAQWGRQFGLMKEERAARMFLLGTLTAGNQDLFDGSHLDETDPYPTLIYDNQPWFDAAHADNVAATTYSNIDAGNALTEANLQTAITTLNHTNARDYRNARMVQRADVLLVPTQLEYTAQVLLNSEHKPGSANNDINTVRGRLRPVVWDFLGDTDIGGDTDCWYIGDTGAQHGFEIWDSGAPTLELIYIPQTQTHRITVVTYYGQTITDWRPWYSAAKAIA